MKIFREYTPRSGTRIFAGPEGSGIAIATTSFASHVVACAEKVSAEASTSKKYWRVRGIETLKSLVALQGWAASDAQGKLTYYAPSILAAKVAALALAQIASEEGDNELADFLLVKSALCDGMITINGTFAHMVCAAREKWSAECAEEVLKEAAREHAAEWDRQRNERLAEEAAAKKPPEGNPDEDDLSLFSP